jgi:hypothetical protein
LHLGRHLDSYLGKTLGFIYRKTLEFIYWKTLGFSFEKLKYEHMSGNNFNTYQMSISIIKEETNFVYEPQVEVKFIYTPSDLHFGTLSVIYGFETYKLELTSSKIKELEEDENKLFNMFNYNKLTMDIVMKICQKDPSKIQYEFNEDNEMLLNIEVLSESFQFVLFRINFRNKIAKLETQIIKYKKRIEYLESLVESK